MATAQAADPTAGGDPTQDPAAGAGSGDGSAAQSYTIEITVSPDGISVGVESAGQEDAESGGESGGSGAQPVKSIKDALTVALQIYRNDGQMSEGSSADDDMASGFGPSSAPASGGQ